ncbi:uncharacterized protein LOC124299679 [Neodiprion virginianus]|uniref:Uncharacterized protein LOC107223361 n=1 Tax=Neodiprion lecontei TaxID=441921 RepID=A0ABM3FUU5_NEOLC|nr:uncharacterized protein LOC124177254 [Neodiprion fabricii]XP_046471293.1 uncharacterized protein LOC124213746 [Neodiprion pinetum]XP_046591782.1 uncharacterized protein LOC107223361 [Neodiprion lecontei]XP_046608913.1 uncharacterized protein LOC124299679 [Neodiprion virginianus]
MTTGFQKSLLGLSVFMTIVLVAVLTSKKFALEARRNALLLEMVANISTDLDKLDDGFDIIASRTEVAKGQLRKLATLHRDNLMICALLHEKHEKNADHSYAADLHTLGSITKPWKDQLPSKKR